MTYLPSAGSGELVTTQYLDLRLEAMKHQITGSVHQEVGTLRGETATQITAQTHAMVFALVTVMLVLASTMIAAVKL